MEILSLVGIFVGLVLMILLAYKGHSIIWVAPVAAFVVVLFSVGAGLGEGRTLLSSYTVDYMQGAGNYFISWFPVFLLGAIYGKVMDTTGAARSLAKIIVKILGERLAVAAVLIPCMILTYGGVSLFVVVFIVYPMGCEIYKAANLPRTQLPAAIIVGGLCTTMTALPGTPQIQNLIPMEYFGTTATAGAWIGIVYTLIVLVPQYLYLDWIAKKAKRNGIGFDGVARLSAGLAGVGVGGSGAGSSASSSASVAGAGAAGVGAAGASASVDGGKLDEHRADELPSWHWLSGLIPLVVVFVTLNLLKINVIAALILGIVACALMNYWQIGGLMSAISDGAKGSVMAMMNTACAVGFGSVIKIVPGFVLLTGLLIGDAKGCMSLLFSEEISAAVLSGATGSASGGLSITLEAFGNQYLSVAESIGLSPEVLHRVAAIAAGSLDKMPHNGALITLLTVCQVTHKEAYKDIFIVGVLMQLVVLFALTVVLGIVL